jgi:hypothetical protein
MESLYLFVTSSCRETGNAHDSSAHRIDALCQSPRSRVLAFGQQSDCRLNRSAILIQPSIALAFDAGRRRALEYLNDAVEVAAGHGMKEGSLNEVRLRPTPLSRLQPTLNPAMKRSILIDAFARSAGTEMGTISAHDVDCHETSSNLP